MTRAWVAAGWLWAATAVAAPVSVPWQGRLLDAGGTPIDGAHNVTVTVYAGGTNTVRWSRSFVGVPFADGYVSVMLDGAGSVGGVLDGTHFDGATDLGVSLDGGAELTPRHVVGTVPKAANGGTAALSELLKLTPRAAPPAVDAASGQVYALAGQPGNDAATTMLFHFDGAGPTVTDSSATPAPVTATGNATQSTAQTKFGAGAAFFDGSGDNFTLTETGQMDFGTGDFTVDAWIYLTNQNGDGAEMILGCWRNANPRWQFGLETTQFKVYSDDGTGQRVCSTAANTVGVNAWTHLAAVRSGGTMKLYVNGVEAASCSYPWGVDCGALDPRIGRGHDGNGGPHYFWGYVDELRVSRSARWTAPFTPPNAAYGGGGLYYMDPSGTVRSLLD